MNNAEEGFVVSPTEKIPSLETEKTPTIISGMHAFGPDLETRQKQFQKGDKNSSYWLDNQALSESIRGLQARSLIMAIDSVTINASRDFIAFRLPDNPFSFIHKDGHFFLAMTDFGYSTGIEYAAAKLPAENQKEVQALMEKGDTQVSATALQIFANTIPETLVASAGGGVAYTLSKIFRRYQQLQSSLQHNERQDIFKKKMSRRDFTGMGIAMVKGALFFEIVNVLRTLGITEVISQQSDESTREKFQIADATVNNDLYNQAVWLNGRTKHSLMGLADMSDYFHSFTVDEHAVTEATSVDILGPFHNARGETDKENPQQDEDLVAYYQLLLTIGKKVFANVLHVPEEKVPKTLINELWLDFCTIQGAEIRRPKNSQFDITDPYSWDMTFYTPQLSQKLMAPIMHLKPWPLKPEERNREFLMYL